VLAVAIGAVTLDRVMLSLALGRRQHGWLFLRRDGSFPQALPRVQPLFTAASVISPYFVGLSAVRAHAAVRMIAIPVSFLVGISRVYLVCTGQLTQSAAGFSLSRGSGSSCWRRPCSSGLLCCPRLFGGCKVSSPALLISKTQPVLAVEIILRFLWLIVERLSGRHGKAHCVGASSWVSLRATETRSNPLPAKALISLPLRTTQPINNRAHRCANYSWRAFQPELDCSPGSATDGTCKTLGQET
jgi:hypothetical protein